MIIVVGFKLEIMVIFIKFELVVILNGSVDINVKFDLVDNEEMVELVGL